MRQLELFPETDVCEELMEHASDLASMLMMRDMLIRLANESGEVSPEQLAKEIAMIEKRLTKIVH